MVSGSKSAPTLLLLTSRATAAGSPRSPARVDRFAMSVPVRCLSLCPPLTAFGARAGDHIAAGQRSQVHGARQRDTAGSEAQRRGSAGRGG
eukprot:1967871-Rhodomonas_salina.1